MNPYDWILLLNLLIKDEQKYEPIVSHLKRMLVSYIQEVGKKDIEITSAFRQKPVVFPKVALEDFDQMKLGKIRNKGWCMALQIKERTYVDFHKVCFYLADKHLYTTYCLQYILEFIDKCKANLKGDNKCFYYLILWYIQVHKALLSIVPKLFEVQRHTQP
ncbi:unnamed protein product [Lactuca saligna]|uniref:Uncharacterized protein n=1 Tax=Lactuca saligna TaxID=75948 RepID=A0AA35ZAD6_LACSI|nr:unnamed protein product [Lactuca saligna]